MAPAAWKNINNRQTRFPGHRVHGHIHFIDNAHYWRSVETGCIEITLVIHSVDGTMRVVVFVAGPYCDVYPNVNYYRLRVTPLDGDVMPSGSILFPDARADNLRYNLYLMMDGRTPTVCHAYCLPKGLQQQTIDYPTYYDREMVTIREDDGYCTTYIVRIKPDDSVKVWRRNLRGMGHIDGVVYRGRIDHYVDYRPDYYYVPHCRMPDVSRITIGLEITPDGVYAHGVQMPYNARVINGRIHAVVDRGMILEADSSRLYITDRNLTCHECSLFDYCGICQYNTYRWTGFDRKMLRLVPGDIYEINIKMGVASVHYCTHATPGRDRTREVAIIQYTKHPRAERDPSYWFGHIPRDIVDIINEYIDHGEWTLIYNGER